MKKKLMVLISVLLIATNCLYVSAAPAVKVGDSEPVIMDEETSEDISEEEVSEENVSEITSEKDSEEYTSEEESSNNKDEQSSEEEDSSEKTSDGETDEDVGTCSLGILGNGTEGIYIDINTTPYTYFAGKANGENAYGTQGCAWFASARSYQITGKDCLITGGPTWYNERYALYGYSRGQTCRAKSLVCYTGHVAVVEKVSGNTVWISEGGTKRSDYAHGYCIIRQTTISALQSSDFLGYVYLAEDASTGQEMTSGYDRVLPDGDYIIASTGSRDRTKLLYLDIQGADYPAKDPTNVSICYTDDPLALPEFEVWTIKYSNGFYKITQKGTNMALDVQDYSRACGANVLVSTSHSGSNQKWAISRNERNGYRIQAKNSGYSLDVAGAVFYNGTNVQMWTGNNEDAQSWIFVPYMPSQPVKTSKYMLVSTLNNNYIMDVAGETGDIPNCQNVQLWQDTAQTKTNEFEVVPLSNGYYKFIHVASRKALEVTDGISNIRANIALFDDNGSIAQQWAIIPNGNGYMLVSRCSGMALDVENGIVANGTNINLCYRNNSAAETWKFAEAEYLIGYNTNGGTGTIASQTKYYKNALKLTTTVPKRNGMEFLGWSTNRYATTPEYLSGATYTKDQSVILYAVWKDKNVTNVFKDISANAWYVNAVQYVYDKGIMSGTGSDTFSPNTALTRAQVVTVLYSMAGKPSQSFNSTFTDVKATDYYAIPVSWAYSKKITSGTGNGKFSPNAKITREQLAVMLYKYAALKKYNLTSYGKALDSFPDKSKVSSYATDAMKWAVTQEIISGKGDGRLDPQGTATRAECAAMVMKLLQKNGQ